MIEITIIRDEATGEYIVRHPTNRDADYFTDDPDDATETALCIAINEFNLSINDVSIVRKVRR
jgi:hypothetical protein